MSEKQSVDNPESGHWISRLVIFITASAFFIFAGLKLGNWIASILGTQARQLFAGATLASSLFGLYKILLTHGRALVSFLAGKAKWEPVEKALIEI